MIDNIKQTLEYKLISEFYADKVANRSQVPLINHINEGIQLLYMIGATEETARAYCLHPLVQADADLIKNVDYLIQNVDCMTVGFSLEYRRVANAYLSHRSITSIDQIELSRLHQVNNMLIADKIQNYKDFIIYHKATHARSKELDEYFNNWLKKLDIDIKAFRYCFNQLNKEHIHAHG